MWVKRQFIWALLPLLVMLWSTSCDKEGFEKRIEIAPFSKINTGENVLVRVWQGEEFTLIVEGTGSVDDVQAYVQNDELFLAAPDEGAQRVEISVYTPSLKAIVYRRNSTIAFPAGFDLKGGALQIDGRNRAELYIHDSLVFQHLSIDLRDTSLMAIENAVGGELYVIEKNYNRCNIGGTVSSANINLFNQALFNLEYPNGVVPFSRPVVAKEYYVETRGQSQAWVYAYEKLWLEAYGTCKVFYKGTPLMLISNTHQASQLLPKEHL